MDTAQYSQGFSAHPDVLQKNGLSQVRLSFAHARWSKSSPVSAPGSQSMSSKAREFPVKSILEQAASLWMSGPISKLANGVLGCEIPALMIVVSFPEGYQV